MSPSDNRLLERDAERAAIDSALTAAACGSGGRVVLVEGEAGIGKSALLGAGAVLAAERGFLVLRARGSELELGAPYGLARQLFEPPLRRGSPARRASLLSGAAAAAAPALGLGPDRGGGPFAVRHGLYWLLDALAGERPVLLCVDDAHWSDAATVRWLAFLAGRLDGLAAAVLVARRSGDRVGDALAVESIRGAERTCILHPAALTESACRSAVLARVGGTADTRFVRACHRASGGNPFLLDQLLDAVAADGLAPTESSAAAVGRYGPAGVRDSIRRRLLALPPGAPDLVAAVAVLDGGAELAVAARLAGLSRDTALDLAAGLQSSGILAPELPLRFAHPLLRAAVYEGLPGARQGALHAAAARLVDDDQAVAHLVAAPPARDFRVVDRLVAAAAEAVRRGAPAEAADLLGRALREPPAVDRRGEVLLALGQAELLAGRPAATPHLESALALSTTARWRAAAVEAYANALNWSGEMGKAVEVLAREVAAHGPDLDEQALTLAAMLVQLATNAGVHLHHVDDGLVRLGHTLDGRSPAERRLLRALCGYHFRQADRPIGEQLALAERGWGAGRAVRDVGAGTVGVGWPILVVLHAGDAERALRMAVEAMSEARATGSTLGEVAMLFQCGYAQYRRGELAEAEADLSAATEAAGLAGLGTAGRAAAGILVATRIALGDLDGARAVLRGSSQDTGELGADLAGAILLRARAALALACGRIAEARSDAMTAVRASRTAGSAGSPTGARLIAAEADRRAGDAGAASALVEEELAVARRVGYRGAEGMALRAQGLLLGDPGLLAESVEVLSGTGWVLELATSLAEHGGLLRRRNDPVGAREPLRRSVELAASCGAAPLLERARTELLAAGGRPRRSARSGVASLTPTERRVAAIAAGGATNADIARTMFVSRKTVETHLAAVYRKLHISGRGQLPPALASPPG